MTEINKLKAWMEKHNYSIKELAKELGVSYYGVYLVFHRARISPGFRLRFMHRFGVETANAIFDSPLAAEPA